MARRKVETPCLLATWSEADQLLGDIVRKQWEVERIKRQTEKRIAALKESMTQAVESYQAAIAEGEKQLALFAKMHEADFGKARSKVLTHGVIGWRQSSEVKLLRTVPDTVALLREIGREDCIRQAEPKVDKLAVRQLTEDEMVSAQIRLVVKDTFYWEPEKTQLPDTARMDAAEVGQ